jgi:hypothetical protein
MELSKVPGDSREPAVTRGTNHPPKKTSFVRILPLLIAAALIASGCVSQPARSDVDMKKTFDSLYKWVQSQKMLEEFPFRALTLDVPTEAEKAGVLLAEPKLARRESKGRQSMVQIITSHNDTGFQLRTRTMAEGNVSVSLLQKGPAQWDLSYESKIKGDMKKVENNWEWPYISFSRNTSAKGTMSSGSAVKEVSYSDTTEFSGDTLLKKTAYKGIDNIVLKDCDTDEPVGIYVADVGFMIPRSFPTYVVKAGDQWEGQAYLSTSVTTTVNTGYQTSGTGLAIQLYTFELAGFATVSGKRCAVIEYVAEHYGMGQSQLNDIKSKEDIRRIAKTLSRSPMSEIREYIKSANPTAFALATSAAQLGAKHYGVYAIDYATGMIVELHAGIQAIMGLGVQNAVQSIPIVTIERDQVVYRADAK